MLFSAKFTKNLSILILISLLPPAQTGRSLDNLPDRAGFDLGLKPANRRIEGHRAQVAIQTVSERHLSVFGLAPSKNEHIRNQFQLGVANLRTDLFRPIIAGNAKTSLPQPSFDLPPVLLDLLAYDHHSGLLRRQPQGKSPGKVLDQHAHKPLKRPERRPVDHDRLVRTVVRAYIFQAEPLRARQIVVQLDGPKLPFAADAIGHHKISLGAIERGFPPFDG